jgi:putative pyruvate formate lyase activating enzyme
MTSLALTAHSLRQTRSKLAAQRAQEVRESLQNCHLCSHHCGVDRLHGETGLCRAGAQSRIFSLQTEVSDELEIIPTFAIALSGCDLRCDFCITGKESWNPRAGTSLSSCAVAEEAEEALQNGAHSIMILGGEPTIHLATALEIISFLPNTAKVIWKTNAHGSKQAREWLDGMVDLWLADYKFGNNTCAERLAKVSDYQEIIRENLLWAHRHNELMIRHLMMPGHIDCCWKPIAIWLSKNLPTVKVNLRFGFWPAWHSFRHSELTRTCDLGETQRAVNIAKDYSLALIP